MGPILGLPALGNPPTVTAPVGGGVTSVDGSNGPTVPVLGNLNPATPGFDDPLNPVNILLGPMTNNTIPFPDFDTLNSFPLPYSFADMGGSSRPPAQSLPSGFAAGPTQWNQMNTVMQAVNNAVTHESNTAMNLYQVSIGNFVGFGQILAGNTPTNGFMTTYTHSQGIQNNTEQDAVIHHWAADGHEVTWHDILQVSDDSINNTWGNCGEQAATACALAQEMLGGQYPNMMTAIGYIAGGNGHAVALLDFDGDSFADGFIDPYYGKYGSIQTLALQEGKPLTGQSPWFRNDGTPVSGVHPPVATPFAGVAP